MEIVYITTVFSLLAFMVLATYDGFYLHLWKYRLYASEESKFEHLAHTIRSILFPCIVFCLLLNHGNYLLFVSGIVFSILDFIVLVLDAKSEQDSRKFMGGLPKNEYILHLFSNAFHYGIVVLSLVINLRISEKKLQFIGEINSSSIAGSALIFIAENAIPGAIILAILHLLLSYEKTQKVLDRKRQLIQCC